MFFSALIKSNRLQSNNSFFAGLFSFYFMQAPNSVLLIQTYPTQLTQTSRLVTLSPDKLFLVGQCELSAYKKIKS